MSNAEKSKFLALNRQVVGSIPTASTSIACSSGSLIARSSFSALHQNFLIRCPALPAQVFCITASAA
jgi:hypothetical protein